MFLRAEVNKVSNSVIGKSNRQPACALTPVLAHRSIIKPTRLDTMIRRRCMLRRMAAGTSTQESRTPQMKILKTLSLAALCLCFVAPLDAQDKGGKKGKRNANRVATTIKRLDSNGNGSIEKDEAKGRIKKAFAKIDGNADGKIEKAELTKYLSAQKSKRGAKNGGKKKGRKKQSGAENNGGEKKRGKQKGRLFNTEEILDESTLDIKILQDWHLDEVTGTTRQKLIEINVAE